MASKGKEYEIKIRLGGETDSSLQKAFLKAETELQALYRISKKSNQGFLDGVDKLDSLANKAFSVAAKGAAVASAGFVSGLTAATVVGASFEEQMSTVQSISQASEADMARLNELAREMGRTTKFSATEAGQGLEYMAMAGWKTEDMLSGLPGIMYLAAASGEDLGLVSDIVTDAMTAFGLSADRSAEFADVLAQASSSSNTNVAMMGETFQYVAPVAGALGFSIQDTATAVGLMANAGIKGSQAGTALRAVMSRLVKPTKEVQDAMNTLGLTVTNSDGSMKSLDAIMKDLRAGFTGLSEAEQASVASALAGQEAMSGLLAIVGASDADYNNLATAINNSAGAAERMSQIRIDNLKGDITILKSGLEGMGIEVYGGFSEDLREGVQSFTGWISDITDNLEEEIPTIRRKAREFAGGMEEIFGPIIGTGQWMMKNPKVVASGLKGIGAALLTFKAAKGATTAVKLLGSLSGVLSAWPVAAAGLAVGGLVGIHSAMEAAAKSRAAENLAEHFGDITLSMEELHEAARHIIGDDLFDTIDAMELSAEKADDLYSSMKDNLQEIRKTGWKLSMGIELDTGDTESYVTAVDNYISNAQSYISEKGYELNLAVNLVFGEDGSDFSSESGAFYQSLLRELDPLKEDISNVLQDITENGLTLDKEKLVSEYLDQMAEITSMITEAENAAKLQMIQGKYAGAALDADSFQNLQAEIADYTNQAIESTDTAYQKILASLNMQRIAGENGKEGGISQQEFDSRKAEVYQSYYEKKAESILNGYQAMADTIMATYGSEIQPALDSINESLNNSIEEIMENPDISAPEDFVNSLNMAISDAVNSSGNMSQDAKNALQMLLDSMVPTEEQLSTLTAQIEQAGGKIPESVAQAFSNLQAMGAAAGNTEDIWGIIGRQISESPEYSLLISTVEQQSGQIPDSAIAAIEGRYGDAADAARGFLDAMRKEFNEGLTVTVPVNLNTIMKSSAGLQAVSKMNASVTVPGGHAEGGIFDIPHIAWFAEDGPEAVVPLDGSANAFSIWEEAGRILGVPEMTDFGSLNKRIEGVATSQSSSQNGGTVTFSPVYNLYGNAGREDAMEAARMSFEEFEAYWERYEEKRNRVRF